ncbi:hypothetical protein [Sanguibacter sp. Z1732]|uniref:hypothetical protein n=1 Tax=Sanguibacter sp. Z1732 TaxID=3435412 RepID=UPI003D9C8540
MDLTEEFTGVTLAVGPDGQVLGYASWDRGSGDGADAVLNVVEILALAPEAYRALWRTLGSFSAVVGRIRLRTSGTDVARLFLPPRQWRTTSVNPYMLRVDDVAAAFSVREVPVRREIIFAVAGDGLGSMDGTYRLRPPGEADDDAPVLAHRRRGGCSSGRAGVHPRRAGAGVVRGPVEREHPYGRWTQSRERGHRCRARPGPRRVGGPHS